MDSTIIRTPGPQISRKQGKLVPFDATDAAALEAWSAEVRIVIAALQEATLDATAKDRVHSRKELRRRLARMMKRLTGLMSTVRPLQTPPSPHISSDPQLEKLRLVSNP